MSLGVAELVSEVLNKANNELVARVERLLLDIRFSVYRFEVREGHGGVFVRGFYAEEDVYTEKAAIQYTRKWLLSPEMTESEIVQTIFKCCYTSFEHRCREHFLYKGKRIFGPHFNVDDLVRLCQDRENAGGRDYQQRRIDP